MEIIDIIFKGLHDACHTSFFFKNGDFTEIKPEYLLTVSVAKQFADHNNLDRFIIKMEESTKNFASSCIPETDESWGFAERHNSDRNGRIDIAIYNPDTSKRIFHSYEPLFPIELKGINPSRGLVLEDLQRNTEYFLLEDKVTGKSILREAYFACIEEAKTFIYKEQKEDFNVLIETKYKSWTSNLKEFLNYHNLTLNIHVREVMSQLVSKDDEYDLKEGNSVKDFIDDSHYYVGVVINVEYKA